MSDQSQFETAEPTVALGIGVGCVLFLVDSTKQPLDKSYFSLLRRELGSIENLTDLEISGEESKFGGVIAIEGDDDDVLLCPNVYHTNIDFELHIPFKVQERLDAICDVEHFYVNIHSSYHMPVMYVHGSGSKLSTSAPSSQVILVRRYLAEKLSDKDVTLHCIGPSPFHADFVCVASDAERRLKDITEEEGYKLYLFKCNDKDTALSEFRGKFGDTLSLFYMLHEARSRCLKYESNAIANVKNLLALKQDRTLLRRLTQSFISRSLIDDINQFMFFDKLCRADMHSSLHEAREYEPSDAFTDLSYHFRELVRFAQEEPYTTLSDVARTYETRRQSALQNFSVLIAGLAGGVLGAVLGSALTYSLTAHSVTPTTQVAVAH